MHICKVLNVSHCVGSLLFSWRNHFSRRNCEILPERNIRHFEASCYWSVFFGVISFVSLCFFFLSSFNGAVVVVVSVFRLLLACLKIVYLANWLGCNCSSRTSQGYVQRSFSLIRCTFSLSLLLLVSINSYLPFFSVYLLCASYTIGNE